MRRLVKIRDLFIYPIDRKRILNEIVCPDTEKIDLACKRACTDGSAWDFDHRANFDSFSHLDLRAAQLLFAFLEHADGAAQFIQPRDHRKHDLDIAHGAGAENGAQLRFENVLILETKPDSAPAKERVQLIADVHCTSSQFIAAEIKCSNDQRIRTYALRNLSVGFVLLVLAWQGFAIQIKKLGAIKSDSLRAVGGNRIDVLRKFDICRKNNVTSIARGGGRLAQSASVAP